VKQKKIWSPKWQNSNLTILELLFGSLRKKKLSLDVILMGSYKMYYKEENGESSHIWIVLCFVSSN